MLLVPCISKGKWVSLEGVRVSALPQLSAYLSALQSHSSTFDKATALIAAVSFRSYREMAVGKGFQVEGLMFLKAKTPAGHT